MSIELTIDGMKVSVPEGTTVFDAARSNGILIPTLCHQQNETPVGVCRVCVVDIEKARVLQASCVRPAENNMVVRTNSERVQNTRHTLHTLYASEPFNQVNGLSFVGTRFFVSGVNLHHQARRCK